MASFINTSREIGEPDYDRISHNYITNEVQEQRQFENIPEIGLCLKRLIDNIQAEANRLASDDPKNSEVHNINGINACNLVEQYIAMTVYKKESNYYPTQRQLIFHMAMNMSYVNGENQSYKDIENIVEGVTSTPTGLEYNLFEEHYQTAMNLEASNVRSVVTPEIMEIYESKLPAEESRDTSELPFEIDESKLSQAMQKATSASRKKYYIAYDDANNMIRILLNKINKFTESTADLKPKDGIGLLIKILDKLPINPTYFYQKISETLLNLGKFQLGARDKMFKALYPLSGNTVDNYALYTNYIMLAYQKEWPHMVNAKNVLADINRLDRKRKGHDLVSLLRAVSADVFQIIETQNIAKNFKPTFANTVTGNNVTKSTMMQSKIQPKPSKGRKQMTSRPKRSKKPCQACEYMAWRLGIESPVPHHIQDCQNFDSKKLETDSNSRPDWEYKPNPTTKTKYPRLPDSFTGNQIFDIPEFKKHYIELPDVPEDTSASSNTEKSDRI